MIDVIKQRIAGAVSNEDKLNKTREFLQLLTLKILFDRKYFNNLAFVGGTALRVLYDLKRFSEDLDFSLIDKKGYSFNALTTELKSDFENYGLKVEAPAKDKNIVNSSMIKFPGILHDLGLSGFKEQKLSIKLEIDTNPPKGWDLALTPVSSPYVFAVNHLDLPSLFSSKIHACLFRKYSKGRDFYDLVWYFGRKVRPNYTLLNNAARQTQGDFPELSSSNIKDFMKQNIKKLDFKVIKKDVERFLEDKKELNMLDRDVILNIISSSTNL